MNLDRIYKIQNFLFLAGILTLPVYQTINHWFFGLFMGLSLLLLIREETRLILKDYIWLIVIVASFFLLRVLGIANATSVDYGTNEAIRALPFLLYPVAILSLKHKDFEFKQFEKTTFYSLSVGCIIAAIICWGNILLTLENDDVAANTLFGWKKSGIYLTQILDIHPPYLGILLAASIIFLFREIYYNKKLSKNKKIRNGLVALVLFVFLFNLTARNALFYMFIISFVFLIYNKKWKLLIVPIAVSIIIGIVVINHPSQYYRLKLYRMLNPKEGEFKDKRFERLKASYSVFKMRPLIGVGPGNDKVLRKAEYKKMNDDIAVGKNLNSHNQFFEYLVNFGLIGGFVFIGVMGFFCYKLARNKDFFYLMLLTNIIVASLTESIFERALGIQYYAILISLIILSLSFRNKLTKSEAN